MPQWRFNEFKHVGVDFDDVEQAQTYEARQKTKLAEERELVQRLGIAAEHTVIEFGCGTGIFALAAAEAGANVIAIDISKAMLNFAQAKVNERNLQAEFVQSGFLSYQPQAPVDFVVTKFALHHLPDFWKAVALQRIHAMLKLGGKFYLEDVVFSFDLNSHETALNDWIDRVSSDSGNGFSRSDFEMHIRDEYSTFGWVVETMLRQAGFNRVEVDYYALTYAEYLCEA
ncbi:MAG: class I SAM-dependent methyltransferase [Leptolyngbyaceae cyanobacterium SM1_3_5]|nr:class I SAM-dependent methyltransferase [Leptolyngbyaceae cyanobacterium SM1_3_5]